jgi:hypothetical protein
VRLVGWGAIYWFFGLMFGVGTYQKYTQHIGVFVTAKSLRGRRLLRLLLRPPDQLLSSCPRVSRCVFPREIGLHF